MRYFFDKNSILNGVQAIPDIELTDYFPGFIQ